MAIKIISAGWGNIKKLQLYFSQFGSTSVMQDFELNQEDILVIPGVGNFDYLSRILNYEKNRKVINAHYNSGGKIIGICSGFQILFESSEEGYLVGLGFMRGEIEKLPKLNMGWYSTTSKFEKVYFMNRFGLKETNLVRTHGIKYDFSDTKEGVRIVSHIRSENILGMQFHPEISRDRCSALISEFLN
jgi:imidazole glycerol-phosphate synthase subunit HisH